MVTRFGMSDRIGLMAVGDGEQEVFLGRELVQRREVSEYTAQQVDEEVKRILDEAHSRAREIVENNRELLADIAKALLERETLDASEIQVLVEGKALAPLTSDFEAEQRTLALPGSTSKPPATPQPGLGGADPLPSPS